MNSYNRFEDALFIQAGACNVSGIARSLVKASDAAREDEIQPSKDPAVRLIVHQLAHLCEVSEGLMSSLDYNMCVGKCVEQSSDHAVEVSGFAYHRAGGS